jgi:putative ABC transport system permease protein
MIIFAGVIFFGSILNSALVSLAERQREIATFRVLGYQPLEVGEIFLRETMLVNMVGALLGLPLGYYMLWGMCLQFQNDMYSVPSVIYPMSWIYTLIWAFVFVLGAYFIIQRSINRMDWSEALKMKE